MYTPYEWNWSMYRVTVTYYLYYIQRGEMRKGLKRGLIAFQGYTVDCRLTELSRGIQGEPIRFQSVKGLPHMWKRDKTAGEKIKPIHLKTKVETVLSFHFTRRDGIRSFVAKTLCKVFFDIGLPYNNAATGYDFQVQIKGFGSDR